MKGIPAGLPAQLLERRPDVVAAFSRLQADDFRFPSAKKLRLPRIILTAAGGTRSTDLTDLGMVMVVVHIPDFFGLGSRKSESSTAILPVGLFAEASIEGRWLENLVILPASALFPNQRVVVIDDENRLRFRHVEVLKREREQIIVKTGLQTGERVLISGFQHPIDGLLVTPVEAVGTKKSVPVM